MKKDKKNRNNPLKEAIKPYIGQKGWLWSFIILSFSSMSLIAILYLCCDLKIDKTILLWMFSASAQSMAALFAVIGMFAVFRHEYLRGVVRNNIDVLKANFRTEEWRDFFNLKEDPDCWDDSIIVAKIESLLKGKEEQSPHLYYNNAEVSNLILKSNQKVLKFLPVYTRVPMILVLITFLISIISIPFTNILVNIASLIITIALLPLIILSLLTIYRYFEITLLTR